MPASDFTDVKLCTHAHLRKAMRTVSQAYDEALKPSGLRATQFTLLSVLAKSGPMPLTRLADIIVVDRTTLTRNLRPLERDGLVASKVTPGSADQRVVDYGKGKTRRINWRCRFGERSRSGSSMGWAMKSGQQ